MTTEAQKRGGRRPKGSPPPPVEAQKEPPPPPPPPTPPAITVKLEEQQPPPPPPPTEPWVWPNAVQPATPPPPSDPTVPSACTPTCSLGSEDREEHFAVVSVEKDGRTAPLPERFDRELPATVLVTALPKGGDVMSMTDEEARRVVDHRDIPPGLEVAQVVAALKPTPPDRDQAKAVATMLRSFLAQFWVHLDAYGQGETLRDAERMLYDIADSTVVVRADDG